MEKQEKKESKTRSCKCPWCGKPSKTREEGVKHERSCPKRPVKYKED